MVSAPVPLRIPNRAVEARIAEARLLGCLSAIYDAGGMEAVMAAVTRALRELVRFKPAGGWIG